MALLVGVLAALAVLIGALAFRSAPVTTAQTVVAPPPPARWPWQGALAGMVAAGGLMYLWFGDLTLALVLSTCGLALGPALARWQARTRATLVATQLETVIRRLTAAMRAGASPEAALIEVAPDTPAPLGPALERAVGLQIAGRPLGDALAQVRDDINDESYDALLLALQVNRQCGGNLARLLDEIGVRLHKARLHAARRDGLLAGGRYQGYILSAMPFLVYRLEAAAVPDAVGPFSQSALGRVIICAAVTMTAAAFVWIQRILTSE